MSHVRIAQSAEAVSRTLAERCQKIVNRKDLPEFAVQKALVGELTAGFKHLKDEGFLHEAAVEDGFGTIHIECALYVPVSNITVTFKVLPMPPTMMSEVEGDNPFAPSTGCPVPVEAE